MSVYSLTPQISGFPHKLIKIHQVSTHASQNVIYVTLQCMVFHLEGFFSLAYFSVKSNCQWSRDEARTSVCSPYMAPLSDLIG